jgi:hypothetical protein
MRDEGLERLLEIYRRPDSKLSRPQLEALVASDKPTEQEREAMKVELDEHPPPGPPAELTAQETEDAQERGILPHEPAPSLTDRCRKLLRIR